MPGPVRTNAAPGSSRQLQPPRPPNAWILYRSDKLRELPPSSERRAQADVSRLISDMWKKESEAVKLEYERMADAKKAEHQRMYPDYRFQPMKKEDKARMREKQKLERERARAEKKPRRATAATVPSSSAAVSPPPPSMLLPPAPPAMPQQVVFNSSPFTLPPPYTMSTQMPYFVPPFSSETRYGPAGPSPPLSAASSPNDTASSPEPHFEEKLQASGQPSASSSLCTSPELHGPSASLALPPNSLSLSQLVPPGSQLPSPNPCVPQSLPETHALSIEQSQRQQLLPPQHQPQPTSSEVVLPSDWDQLTATQLSFFDSHNPEEFLDFTIPFPPNQPSLQPQQGLADFLQLEDAMQSLTSAAGDRGIFSLTTPDPSELVSQPHGELEVAIGPQMQPYDFNTDFFTHFDFSTLDLPVEPTQTTDVAEPIDLASLFRAPDNPELHGFNAVQRQPSLFTQDVMQYLNLDAAECPLEDAAMMPATATVAPQQVRNPACSPSHGQPIAIFTQVTNAPAAEGSGQYIPPAGAVNSAVRRVGGSWKPPVMMVESSAEPFFQSWNVPAS